MTHLILQLAETPNRRFSSLIFSFILISVFPIVSSSQIDTAKLKPFYRMFGNSPIDTARLIQSLHVRDSVRAEKKTMSPLLRKYYRIRYLIEMMTKDSVKSLVFNSDLPERYKHKRVSVDNYGRMHCMIILKPGSKITDTTYAIKAIKKEKGLIEQIYPDSNVGTQIYCWLPYDKIVTIANHPKIYRITKVNVFHYKYW